MIKSEPLVEVAVRQDGESAREGFLFAVPPGAVASGSGEEASKKQNLQPWNEASLNFISLRSSLHYVGLGRLSRVEMNAQKTGALDRPSQPEGRSAFHFSIDMADDFIDGVISITLIDLQYSQSTLPDLNSSRS